MILEVAIEVLKELLSGLSDSRGQKLSGTSCRKVCRYLSKGGTAITHTARTEIRST